MKISSSSFAVTRDVSVIEVETSGTTGSGKTVRRRLNNSSYVSRTSRDGIWFVPYPPSKWAFVTSVMHIWSTGGTMSVPEGPDLTSHIETIITDRPNFMTCTPTYLKMLLSLDSLSLKAAPLSLISLGGEVCRQRDLDTFRDAWPSAELYQTYATTEFGDLAYSRGPLEGFHRSVFEKNRRISISLEGELFVDGIPTGDFWELANDRYRFSRRKGNSVQVFGHLVDLEVVRQAVLSIKDVSKCSIRVTPSPMMGNRIELLYVGSIDPESLRGVLAMSLRKVEIPSIINRRDLDAESEAWKGA